MDELLHNIRKVGLREVKTEQTTTYDNNDRRQ